MTETSPTILSSETTIRAVGMRLVLAGQGAIVLGLALAALLKPGGAPAPLGAGLALFLASGLLARLLGQSESGRMAISALLMAQVMLLVAAMAGHPYQMDMHMAFFAGLGLVAFLICWRALAAATAVIAIHHLVLNFVYPAAVFSDGADFARVMIHAVIVLVEAAALLLLARTVADTLAASGAATGQAELARAEAEALMHQTRAQQTRDADRQKGLEQAISAFSGAIGDTLSSAEKEIAALQGSAAELSAIATQSRERVDSAVSNAGDAADNVGSVAHAAGELAKSIGEIAGQVQSTSESVTAVRGAGEASLKRMDELTVASDRIGNVVTLIQNIASQTNLLALNATIEAARAGDAGRGFAVVASEVKDLAAQTGRATEEIGTEVQAVQKAATESVEAIKAIVQRMIEVDQFMASIAAAVEEQDSTTRDMSDTMASAARNAAMSSGALQELRAQAEQVGAVARTVLCAAELVRGATGTVEGEVSKFISVARAG